MDQSIVCGPRPNVPSRLAQLVERKTLNLVVVGSSPTVGVVLFFCGFQIGLKVSLFNRTRDLRVDRELLASSAIGVLAQSEARVLSKDEVLGSKPRYSSTARMV